MRIQHNVTALNAYRNLRGNNSNLAKNLEKLSSGYRINRAGDDAAGLAVSEKMRAQITGLEAATKNAQDGISLVQTAEGALTEVHSMLNRMASLATQSANGTYDNEVDRANLQKEVASLKKEIDRISESSNYNGIKLLDGSLADGAMKSKLPNVTVNGVTGQAATGGVKDIIEVKKADDYRFNGTFKLGEKLTNTKFTATGKGETIRTQVKYNDASGQENIIEMKLVNDGTGKIDVDKSSVTLNGKALKNSEVFKGKTGAGVMGDEKAGIVDIKDILNNIEPFADLFEVSAQKENAGKMEAATAADATHLTVKAKQESGSKAEVTSVLTNGSADVTNADNGVLKDAALNLLSKKETDNITVHGAKIHGIAKGKVSEEDLKKAIIEVNGEKFLFVNKTDKNADDVVEAIKKLGIKKENIVYSNAAAATGTQPGMAKEDVKEMVKTINKALGEEVAAVGTAADTDIVFAGKDQAGNADSGLSLQIGDTADKFNKMTVAISSMSASSLGIKDVDISTQDGASNAIAKIKNAINSVSSTRGDLGALQNRLDHTINNLGVMHENITEAESRIRDTDMAKEMMAYAKNNILVQSSTAMLAQANQLPQGVLQLLQ